MIKSWRYWGILAVVLLTLYSCSGDNGTGPVQPKAPTVSTAAVGAITETTAECGGTIISDGGAAITTRGICWSTDATPSIADDITVDGTGTGSFTSSLTGLTAGTPYYARAYATNSVGTSYGSTQSFSTTAPPSTVTDIDGNVYQTVTIGTQVWMAENLKVTRYRNGDAMPDVTDGFAWEALTTGAHCNYDNSPENTAVYGRLYNWYAVNDSRNIAPEGWHVATASDWMTLVSYLGSDPGGKLKDNGTVHWLSPNTGATNETGFTALPGGQRGYQGGYSAMGQEAYFWTATEYNTSRAYVRSLDYSDTFVALRNLSKYAGHSVRCIKD
ncbi:MAG: fibrobacter succinogenes major paralogous domain-containing protein [Candidatus Zixiibacteriota bacterium]